MDNEVLIKELVFLLCSVLSVSFAFLVIFFKNPIYSSISLIASFIPIAIIFLLLHAPFIAVIEILVYAGAIMVLFTFVIMMVNLKQAEYLISKSKTYKLISIFLVLFFFVLVPLISFIALPNPTIGQDIVSDNLEDFGSTRQIGELIFGKTSGDDLLSISANSIAITSFELASILIMVALVGAFVLARTYKGGGK